MSPRRSLSRTLTLAAIAFGAVALITGCTGPTVTDTQQNIAESAETALENQAGIRPEIDCGTETIELRNGLVVNCVLTDPTTDEDFATSITIIGLDGADYEMGIEVAATPLQ